MSEEKYYVISNSDGDTYIEEYSKEKLLEVINEKDCEYIFMDNIKVVDINYWSSKDHLIIKGKIVVPKEKKVVLERDIE